MADSSSSIVEAFVRHAEGTPEKPCLLFEGEEWSYEELRERAATFASALRSWGLNSGERVALFLGNSPNFLTAYLGTHLAGAVIVPVNTAYRRGGGRDIFDYARGRLCLTHGGGGPEP